MQVTELPRTINVDRPNSVRIFLSSTFRDMHAERDRLLFAVFPELRERLITMGLNLRDIDLRWGVPRYSSDVERANSWDYCKRRLQEDPGEAAVTFFVGLLGQRYGWVPGPNEIRDAIRLAINDPRMPVDLAIPGDANGGKDPRNIVN